VVCLRFRGGFGFSQFFNFLTQLEEQLQLLGIKLLALLAEDPPHQGVDLLFQERDLCLRPLKLLFAGL